MNCKQLFCKKIAVFMALLLFSLVFFVPSTAETVGARGYINGVNVNIRKEPTTESGSVGKLSEVYVDLLETVQGQNATGWGTTWYKIKYGDIVGYVYGQWFTVIEQPAPEPEPLPDLDFETQLLSFPESYREPLRKIKAEYPNWSFKADNLALTFKEAVDGEDVFPLKLVPAGYSSSWKSMGKNAYNWETGTWYNDAGNWQAASTEVIAYYMDPRNFLNANDIYMFAQQSYDASMQSQSGLERIVQNTFLANGYSDPNDTAYGGSYINVIMEAARQSGMSPYVIASLIIIEQGSSGNSTLISGNNETYPNCYNFFNYGASGTTNAEVVANGLKKAQELGWNTRSKSIIEGAKRSANNYIAAGQDTYYYMDFDVKDKPYFTHQYAQSVMDALNKGSKLRGYYSENKNAALSFAIPIFKDMPSTATPKVESNSKLNNYYLKSLSVDGFKMYTEKYTFSIDGDTTLKYTLPEGAEYVGEKIVPIKTGSNTVVLTVKAQTGYTNEYILTVNSSKDCNLTVTDADKEPQQPETPENPDVPDNPENPPPAVKRGDINGDGELDIIDSTALRLHFLKLRILSTDELERADITKDGEVDILDSTALRLHFLKIKPIED